MFKILCLAQSFFSLISTGDSEYCASKTEKIVQRCIEEKEKRNVKKRKSRKQQKKHIDKKVQMNEFSTIVVHFAWTVFSALFIFIIFILHSFPLQFCCSWLWLFSLIMICWISTCLCPSVNLYLYFNCNIAVDSSNDWRKKKNNNNKWKYFYTQMKRKK